MTFLILQKFKDAICLWFGLINCTVLECVSDGVFIFLRQPLPRYNRVDIKNVDVKLAMSLSSDQKGCNSKPLRGDEYVWTRNIR